MNIEEIEKEVIKIVVEQLNVDIDEVNLDKSFIEDFNADSLDLTELIMTFEEKFSSVIPNFEIPEKDVAALTTVGDVVNYIKDHLKS